MATQKQIDANRRNAQKSTGPKTDEGKLRSRTNSLKHGLASLHVPLPHEDPSEFLEARAGLTETWQPANAQEAMLVDTIATAWVRMQRSSRFEAGLIQAQLDNIKRRNRKSRKPTSIDDAGVGVAMSDPENLQAWQTLERYQNRAQSAYYRAIEMLRKLQNDRRRQGVQQAREEQAHQAYLKRTVAPVTRFKSAPVASFGPEPQDSAELGRLIGSVPSPSAPSNPVR